MRSRHNTGVVIPVKGRTTLLYQALDSICTGSVLPEKIIVVMEDYSSWKEQKLQQRFADFSPFISVLPGKNTGPAAARNTGVQSLTTEYVAFLDSDDLWHRNKLEMQLCYMQKRPHLQACHNFEIWQSPGGLVPQPARLIPGPGRFLKESFAACLISASSLLLKRELFLKLGAFDESFYVCEDFEFFLRLLSATPAGLVPEALVTKRTGDWEQLSSAPNLDFYRLRALIKYLSQPDSPLRAMALSEAWKKLKICKTQAIKFNLPGIAEMENTLTLLSSQIESKA